ncbi:MAG: ABC transporter substrate-binding protein [Hyphomicrobium sp.]|nr:ABC transporter substrate-binding protein [Hyphomicrobium sp.]
MLLAAMPVTAALAGDSSTSEGEVNILTWPGYIERGETDKNYDWVTDFEKQTGCIVKPKIAGTSDEMVSLMNQAGFDVVIASGDATLRLIAGKRVQPIDINRLTNWKLVDERLQSAPWHTVDGVHYGVPYQWGPNLLLYSTTVFKEPPTSWSVVFQEQTLPDGKSNKGRVQAYNGPIYIADAALFLMRNKPELKITNPYELNEEQYKEAVELVRQQRPLVARYWYDAMAQIDDFKTEGVVASSSWPFQVNLLLAEGRPIGSTIPDEGATAWADTQMLHIQAKHPNCAYKWFQHSLSEKLQGDVSAWVGSNPAVPAACKGNALLTDEGCKKNGFENFDKLWFWRTPTAKCQSSGSCVPYSQWASDYVAIRGQ